MRLSWWLKIYLFVVFFCWLFLCKLFAYGMEVPFFAVVFSKESITLLVVVAAFAAFIMGICAVAMRLHQKT
jgi:hypothetical protein